MPPPSPSPPRHTPSSSSSYWLIGEELFPRASHGDVGARLLLGLATTPPGIGRTAASLVFCTFPPRQSHGREAERLHRGELRKTEYFRDLPSVTLGLQRTWPRANTAGRGLPGHAISWLCLDLPSQVREKSQWRPVWELLGTLPAWVTPQGQTVRRPRVWRDAPTREKAAN